MREILFRGKRLDNGEWIEGNFYESGISGVFILRNETRKTIDARTGEITLRDEPIPFEVRPSTIGQYVGLTDKNGKRIFEGDIVRTHYANDRNADFVEQVVFHNGRFSSLYELRGPGNGKMWANLPDGIPHLTLDKTPYMEWCEIIGNIYDNPEFLKEGDV